MEKTQTVGERLRDERVRLGLSQEELAALCGVTRPTQYRYESGKSSPSAAYFAAAAANGVNVPAVLGGPVRVDVKINATEIRLIDAYRMADKRIQEAVENLLLGARSKHPAIR